MSFFGLLPGLAFEEATCEDFNPDSQLLRAAKPALDHLETSLRGTGFAVILADADARLVDIRYGDRSVRNQLENLGMSRGRVVTEEVIGTNAIGTVIETGRGLQVNGEEHFAHMLQSLSCYGHPIKRRGSRRLAGVLDISCTVPDKNPLLPPLIMQVVREIEKRLLSSPGRRRQTLFEAFEFAACNSGSPVVAFSDDVYLANAAACHLFTAADQPTLVAAVRSMPSGEAARTMLLTSCGTIPASVKQLPEGAIVTLSPQPHETMPGRSNTKHIGSLLVSGEPGTGRTTVVQRRLSETDVLWHDSARRVAEDTNAWIEEVACSLNCGEIAGNVVVIENIHLLPESIAYQLANLLSETDCPYILTSCPTRSLQGESARLASLCNEQIEIAPLRYRSSEIPSIIAAMLRSFQTPIDLKFTPGALTALTRCRWPGNLIELRRLIDQLAANRCGQITSADLPKRYQVEHVGRAVTPIEHAERDAVIAALRDSCGNKKAAAYRLGISRTTLYRLIDRYGINR